MEDQPTDPEVPLKKVGEVHAKKNSSVPKKGGDNSVRNPQKNMSRMVVPWFVLVNEDFPNLLIYNDFLKPHG